MTIKSCFYCMIGNVLCILKIFCLSQFQNIYKYLPNKKTVSVITHKIYTFKKILIKNISIDIF